MLPLQVAVPPFQLSSALDLSFNIGNDIIVPFVPHLYLSSQPSQNKTVIRYNTHRPLEKHHWNFSAHQIHISTPQLASQNISSFLRSCHCPPYLRTPFRSCPDWQCDLPRSLLQGNIVSVLTQVDSTVCTQLIQSQLTQALAVVIPQKDQLAPKSVKLLAIVKDTNLRPNNTTLFREVGDHIIHFIRKLIGPVQQFEFNMTHCYNNSGGYSTITAHNLLLSALKNVSEELRFKINISLMPGNGKKVNSCTDHMQYPPICLTCYQQHSANTLNWCANMRCPNNKLHNPQSPPTVTGNPQSESTGATPKSDKALPLTETGPLTKNGYYTTQHNTSISAGANSTNPSFASAVTNTQGSKELNRVFAPPQVGSLTSISDKKYQPRRSTTSPQTNNLITCPSCDHKFPQPLPSNEVMDVSPDSASPLLDFRPETGYDKRLQDAITVTQQHSDSQIQSLQAQFSQGITELTQKLQDMTVDMTTKAERDKKQQDTLAGKIGELGKNQQQLTNMKQQIDDLTDKQGKMQRTIDALHAKHQQLEKQINDHCLTQPVTDTQLIQHQPDNTPSSVPGIQVTNADNTNTFNDSMTIDENMTFDHDVNFERSLFGEDNSDLSDYSQQSSLLPQPLLPESGGIIDNKDTTDDIVNVDDPLSESLPTSKRSRTDRQKTKKAKH